MADNSKTNCVAVQIFGFFVLEMNLHTISLNWSKFEVKFSFCYLTVKEQRWVILKDCFSLSKKKTNVGYQIAKKQPDKKFIALDTTSNSLFILIIISTKEGSLLV